MGNLSNYLYDNPKPRFKEMIKLSIGVIYQIKCMINNRIYIGQTKNFDKRIYEHKWELQNNRHYNKRLQQDYNLYGSDNFQFTILHKNINQSDLLLYETNYINQYGGIESDMLYNEEDKFHFTNLVRQNMSKNRKGKLCGKDNGMYGVCRYGEENPMYGKHHSEKTKQIISEKSKIGKKYYKYTPELVDELRIKRKNGYMLKDLEAEYGIAVSTLSTLINHGSSKNSLNKV